MNVEKKSKKKVKEELDLIKIAEAFGGYVVEANGKNGKKNDKKRDSIDDFIDAENPFDVQAQKDAQRDIEQTGGTDTRPNFTRQDTFQKSGKFRQPEKNPLRKKGGTPKPKSQKLADTTIGGPVKIIQRAKRTKFAPTPKKSTASKFTDRESTKDFLKDIGDEPLGSEGMKTDAEKIIKQGRKAERVPGGVGKKTGSISKGDLEFSGDKAYRKERQTQKTRDMNYQQRMQQAFDVGSGAPRFTDIPDAQPLPAAPRKQKKGEPQKPRPRAQKPPEGTYSRVGGQREVIGKVDTKVTGGEYGKLRSGQTADQTALNQALTGRDAEGNPLSVKQRRELMKKSRGNIDSDAFKNVSKNVTKGAMPTDGEAPKGKEDDFKLKKGGRFNVGRDNESISMKPKPKSPPKNPFVDVFTNKKKARKVGDEIGTKTMNFASDKLKQQSQSMTGAMGGLMFKTAFPASAGLEAGIQLNRGDKLGASLSALQSMGGGLGFGAGVLNALRMRSPSYTVPKPRPPEFDPKSPGPLTTKGQVRMDRPKGEKEAMMAGGGVVLSRILQNVRRAREQGGGGPIISPVRGGRAGRRSAKQ